MQDTQVRSQGRKESLEIIMAAHSSNFAWGIPWTEYSDRLQSMGLQGVEHTEQISLSFLFILLLF